VNGSPPLTLSHEDGRAIHTLVLADFVNPFCEPLYTCITCGDYCLLHRIRKPAYNSYQWACHKQE
jgi:hypothetical protein